MLRDIGKNADYCWDFMLFLSNIKNCRKIESISDQSTDTHDSLSHIDKTNNLNRLILCLDK